MWDPGKKKKWICKAMLGVTDDPAETPPWKTVLGCEHLITSRVPTNGVSVGRKDTRVMEEGNWIYGGRLKELNGGTL